MFGVEPQERWTAEEKLQFEKQVTSRHKKVLRDAAWAAAALVINILCLIPFLYGHSLHRYWDVFGKYLLLLALAAFLWLVLKAGLIWASWQAACETRHEYGDPL
jgi:hypothetical protein